MTRRHFIFVLILIPVLVACGFYLRALYHRTFFENRQRPESEIRTQLSQQALQSEAGAQRMAVALYFPDYDTGTLDQEGRQIALAANYEDRIRQVVLALIQGSEHGHARPLPSTAALRAVFLAADGTAYLDFSSDITRDFPVGIESETLAIYSVVDSLAANIPAVERVKFLIQGQEVDTLAGHADLTGFYAPNTAVRTSTALVIHSSGP
ncbi:MAG: GerMN domain-containing protein [Terriglobia bacterium]